MGGEKRRAESEAAHGVEELRGEVGKASCDIGGDGGVEEGAGRAARRAEEVAM